MPFGIIVLILLLHTFIFVVILVKRTATVWTLQHSHIFVLIEVRDAHVVAHVVVPIEKFAGVARRLNRLTKLFFWHTLPFPAHKMPQNPAKAGL